MYILYWTIHCNGQCSLYHFTVLTPHRFNFSVHHIQLLYSLQSYIKVLSLYTVHYNIPGQCKVIEYCSAQVVGLSTAQH